MQFQKKLHCCRKSDHVEEVTWMLTIHVLVLFQEFSHSHLQPLQRVLASELLGMLAQTSSTNGMFTSCVSVEKKHYYVSEVVLFSIFLSIIDYYGDEGPGIRAGFDGALCRASIEAVSVSWAIICDSAIKVFPSHRLHRNKRENSQ